MDNKFLLEDRLQKIRSVVNQYGEDNFILSFSGGKDSTVLSALVDLALPDNKITRVHINTGVEFDLVEEFVNEMCEKDSRYVIIKPKYNIKETLERYGYPFKSKRHSQAVYYYQNDPDKKLISWQKYYKREYSSSALVCPYNLQYQFEGWDGLKISDKCCDILKKQPIQFYQKRYKKPYAMIGLRREEGGRRMSAQCLVFAHNRLKAFQPLVAVTNDWVEWFISEYNVQLCKLYYPPYSFERTGCKGCPFNPQLQYELDVLSECLPNEKKQCEAIWKPVYDEYRRIGYRIKIKGH